MRAISILITGIGGDIGESIIKCLHESDYNLKIYGCDIDSYASGRIRVLEFFESPRAIGSKKYTTFLNEVLRDRNIDYIFPSSEAEIEYFHMHRNLFEQENVRIVINNKIILDNFLDKYKTSLFLRGASLPYANTFLINEYRDQLEYPLIIKMRKGSGSKLVLVVNNHKEFAFYKDKHQDKELIVQEYLGSVDHEYTVGLFSDGNKSHCIAFRRYLSSDVGITKFAQLTINKDIDKLGKKIAEATGLKGSLNIQVRKTENGFVPFEINPRISGTSYVRHRFGFKDVQWWLDLNENTPIIYTPRYKHGVAVRVVSEVFYDLY